jgi:CRISPR-associated protein Cas2
MRGVSDYTVVYDITSDAERRRVDRVLKGFGFRVQKSVFECRMDRKARRDLLRELRALRITTGFVKVYRLEYSSRGEVVGRSEARDIDGDSAYIV